jgi:murein L,D-transpeptidase YcbB/YkuD
MSHGRAGSVPFLLFLAVSLQGCGGVDRTAEITAALREIAAGKPSAALRDDVEKDVQKDVWKDLQTFYALRDGKPAWDDAADASRVLEVLRTAPAHGFAAADYGEPDLAARVASLAQAAPDAPERIRQTADVDARLTTALLAFGRDVSMGRGRTAPFAARKKSERTAPELGATLAHAVDDPEAWVDSIRPPHPEYAALSSALVSLQSQREKEKWPVVADKLAPGRSSPSTIGLRRRLAAGGHLSAEAASNPSPVFLEGDQAAVQAFQHLHGLKATGVVDAATLAALNVSIDERIRQIAINLERWRAMPNDFGARHLIVNIPSYHLVAREHGKPVMDIRVVVGKTANKTPVFSSAMSTVVFSPYWNIPDSIVEGETAPAVARDPAYLARNNIEVLDVSRAASRPVAYADVDWDDENQLRHLAFRQKPGPANALGHVKFLFPNSHDVYIHDTPADRLFSRVGRALSHGCVRVEEPEALAKYILGGYPEWDDESILEAMNAGVEKHVKLTEPIPVHLVYFTAWVDENGGLHFQPDIYGYDSARR